MNQTKSRDLFIWNLKLNFSINFLTRNYSFKYKIALFSIFLMALFQKEVNAQSTRYWSTNLNEESSLLAGAVVGGGAGVGAIYYNPALISANTKSNLSINANLFTIEFNRIENALGDNFDLKNTRFLAEPRFLSYILKSHKIEGLSYEFIAMGKENFFVNLSSSTDSQIDILTHLPGEERYYASYKYRNQYISYWLGAGTSYKFKNDISIGISMFGMVKTLNYSNNLSINAQPLSDSIEIGGIPIPYYVASSSSDSYLKFENYRLLWKIGLAYKKNQIKIGFNITTPSVNVFSSGKVDSGKEQTGNIMYPDEAKFMPDYLVADEQVKDDVSVNYKDPFSIAMGIEYTFPSNKQFVYFTAEYFSRIRPYKFVTAQENSNSTIPSVYEGLMPKDWLSYVSGAKPILNIALGYKWELNQDLLLLTGFKTDFSYMNNFDFEDFEEYNNLAVFDHNVYHFSGGLLYRFLGHRFFTGIQYSTGSRKGMEQLVNLSDPVEWNEIEQAALQGVRNNNMNYYYNGISLFLGVTFNFGNNSGKDAE